MEGEDDEHERRDEDGPVAVDESGNREQRALGDGEQQEERRRREGGGAARESPAAVRRSLAAVVVVARCFRTAAVTSLFLTGEIS